MPKITSGAHTQECSTPTVHEAERAGAYRSFAGVRPSYFHGKKGKENE
jgi:hypothetical protein